MMEIKSTMATTTATTIRYTILKFLDPLCPLDISPVNGESHTGCVPGTISLVKSPHGLCVATADGWLNIKTLQLEGKKKMPVTDLLRGLKIKENAFFV